MFTSLIMDGVLKIVQVVRHTKKANRVARIYDPKATIPEAILKEISNNHFYDEVYGREYILTPEGLTPVL